MNRQHKTLFILTLLIVGGTSASSLFMTGSLLFRPQAQSLPVRSITLRDRTGHTKNMKVEVADTPAAWETGLMYRKSVTKGMLFVFDQAQTQTFWMKNTLVPLDIIFFGENGSFVSSQTMTPCTADPCTMYSSVAPARYALEMPAGFTANGGIAKGWTLVPPSFKR